MKVEELHSSLRLQNALQYCRMSRKVSRITEISSRSKLHKRITFATFLGYKVCGAYKQK